MTGASGQGVLPMPGIGIVPHALGRVAVVGDQAPHDLAHLAGLDVGVELLVQGRVEARPADLQHAAGLLHEVVQPGGFVDRVRHRLLEVHVLARQQGRPRDGIVQVIGHDDDDAVDVGAREQGLVVASAALGPGLRLRVLHARLPDVADLHELDVPLPFAPRQEPSTQQVLELHAAADEAESNAIVGAEDATRRRLDGWHLGCRRANADQRRACHGAGGPSEELTSRGGCRAVVRARCVCSWSATVRDGLRLAGYGGHGTPSASVSPWPAVPLGGGGPYRGFDSTVRRATPGRVRRSAVRHSGIPASRHFRYDAPVSPKEPPCARA